MFIIYSLKFLKDFPPDSPHFISGLVCERLGPYLFYSLSGDKNPVSAEIRPRPDTRLVRKCLVLHSFGIHRTFGIW